MIDFSGKTYTQVLNDMLDRVSSEYDKRETSIIKVSLMPVAKELSAIYESLSTIQKQAYILTADSANIDMLAILKGLIRKEATAAIRKISFNIAVDADVKFSTQGINILTYTTMEKAVLNEESGYYEAKALCDEVGSKGNEYYGAVLPVGTITDLTYAYMSDVITEGTDQESDISLRTRFLNSLGSSAYAGNIASKRESALAISGVGACQVYPHWKGAGTTLISIINSNYDKASDSLVESAQNTLCPPEDGGTEPSPLGFGVADVGDCLTIGTATERELNLSFDVQLENDTEVSAVEDEVKEKYEEYLLSVRQTWGNALTSNTIKYPVNIYLSRILIKLMEIEKIVNITNLKINDSDEDIECVETSELQELPIMGTININKV